MLQDAFSFFMKFTGEVIRHCFSNMEAAHLADITMKLPHPGSNGLVQNGLIAGNTKDKAGYDDEERILKAKQLKKRLLTHRRRRRRHSSTLSDDDGSSDSDGDVHNSRCDESDLSEGELEELLNESMSEDEDESNVSSLSDDGIEGVHKFGSSLVNGGTNMKGKTDQLSRIFFSSP